MANPAEKDPNTTPSKTTSRRAKAGWAVAVFFIAAWMFGMGVMVGRETAPVRFDLDQLKKTLESLQRAPRVPQKNAPPIESTEMKDKTKLDFYEVLPKNREDADVNLPKPTPPGSASTKAQETPAQAKAEKPPTVPATPPAPKTEKPALVPAPPPPPAPAAAVPGQAFTVQVSAVKSEEEARRMVERLRQRGYAAHVEATALPDKNTWYRVRMGEFPTRESARGTVDRLQKDGFGSMVVPK
jgi:cell division septation protein DedD